MNTYKLDNLTKEHLNVLAIACDLYSRCIAGQLDTVAHSALNHLPSKEFCEIREELDKISGLVWIAYGCKPGIHSDNLPEDARIAYDLHQVIRHQIWLDNKAHRAYVVDAYPCHQTSKKCSPATITNGEPYAHV
jgi:hypothetical protein